MPCIRPCYMNVIEDSTGACNLQSLKFTISSILGQTIIQVDQQIKMHFTMLMTLLIVLMISMKTFS